MNTNDLANWDLAHLRANASHERAKAYRELKAQFRDWLRRTHAHPVTRATPRGCLDADC